MSKIIVSRHPGAVAFIRDALPEWAEAEVKAEVKADDVWGHEVIGNLPLHLACLCDIYIAVEFEGPPPRGAEFGIEEMKAAGARLQRYSVRKIDA